MSVDNANISQRFTMDNATAAFTFTFNALHASPEDIKCKKIDTNGSVSTLAYTTDYSVAVNVDGSGGVVTLVSSAGTDTLFVYRDTTDLQESDYEDYNQFPAETVETDLDRRTLKSQEQDEAITRAIKFPITASRANIDLPTPVNGQVLVWSGTGGTLVNSEFAIVAAHTFGNITVRTKATIADLEATVANITGLTVGTVNITNMDTVTIGSATITTDATIAALNVSGATGLNTLNATTANITGLTVGTVNITNMDTVTIGSTTITTSATIELAIIENATISTLTITTAATANMMDMAAATAGQLLVTTTATIENLTAATVNITTKATISDIAATTITVSSLAVTTSATIAMLVATALTASNIEITGGMATGFTVSTILQAAYVAAGTVATTQIGIDTGQATALTIGNIKIDMGIATTLTMSTLQVNTSATIAGLTVTNATITNLTVSTLDVSTINMDAIGNVTAGSITITTKATIALAAIGLETVGTLTVTTKATIAALTATNISLADAGTIELDVIPAATTTGTGIIATMTVDENTVGKCAALHLDSDGHYIQAIATSASTMPCNALALTSVTGATTVLLNGIIRNDTWAWTMGSLVFVSLTTGTLTQTVPSAAGQQVQAVGVALSSSTIYFNPSPVIVEIA